MTVLKDKSPAVLREVARATEDDQHSTRPTFKHTSAHLVKGTVLLGKAGSNDNAVPPSEPQSANPELQTFLRERGAAWERRLYAKLGRTDGEDAAQDVRSLVVVKTASIEAGASRAFAWSAAGWIALQYARSRSRRPTLVGEDGLEIAHSTTQLESTPYDMVETNDKLRVVLRAIGALRESYRAALVLSETVPEFDCLKFYVNIPQRAKNEWEALSSTSKRKRFSRARIRLMKRLCLPGSSEPESRVLLGRSD